MIQSKRTNPKKEKEESLKDIVAKQDGLIQTQGESIANLQSALDELILSNLYAEGDL